MMPFLDPVLHHAAPDLPPGLPDPLTLLDGSQVMSPEQWRQKRRPELLDLFRSQVYGHAPSQWSMTADVVTTPGMMDGAATRYQAALRLSGPSGARTLNLVLFVPAHAARPCPAFLLICNRERACIDPDRSVKSPFWPAEALIARGFAAAAFQVDDVDPDRTDGFDEGIRAAFAPEAAQDSWGAIAAWAWGASRAMDWLETLPEIDAARIGVVGHSRGGKTALWCGAQDERFALTVSNNSGCTGAALARNRAGEPIAAINKSFPHWFCGNYKRYGDHEDDLPVDQHELLALIAPRLLYVASATNDAWADPRSEFLSCVAAEPVYRLLGKTGVGSDRLPPPETPLGDGAIGYHLRTGDHDLTPYDWDCFIDFAEKRFAAL